MTISSVNPNSGATGVASSAQIVFTFSAPMYTTATMVLFTNAATPGIAATPAWSAGNTVLTYTPVTGWPANSTIDWTVYGIGAAFQELGGTTTGSFSTSSGSSGIGTNKYTTFQLIRAIQYDQLGTGAPILDPQIPYAFFGVAYLASNRTPTAVTLTMPTGGVSNLLSYLPNNIHSLTYGTANLSTIDTLFPSGSYSFYVQAASSNQTLGLTLPTTNTLHQPNAPHVNNYAAAQVVNAGQNFTVTWDAFQGGSVTDYVSLAVSSQSGSDVFRTPDILVPGALTGTATSALIPASTLQANSNYVCTLTFFKSLVNTNNGDNGTWVVRAAMTEFNLATFTSPLVITNVAAAGGNMNFNVRCATNQIFTVYSASNLTTAPWLPRLTTNAAVSLVKFVDPIASTNRTMFYRLKNGAP